MRVWTLVCAALALVALAPAAAAGPSASCQPVPAIGLVCTFDAQSDGVPERVYVYDPNGLNALLFDAAQSPGFESAMVGSGTHAPGYATGLERAKVSAFDSNLDNHPERVDARVDAIGPSNVGGYFTVAIVDANSDGAPEYVDLFVWNTEDGARYQRIETGFS